MSREDAEYLFRYFRTRSTFRVVSENNIVPTVTLPTSDNGVSAASMQSGDYWVTAITTLAGGLFNYVLYTFI